MVVILAELAEQMRERNLSLELNWTPRDQNEEADDLTNGRYGRFDMAKRIDVKLDRLEWLVLPDMLALSEDLYREVQEEKAKRKGEQKQGTKDKKKKALKEREPW